MKKMIVVPVAICGLAILIPGVTRGEGKEATAEEMYRKAYLIERDGRKALYEEDLPAAYDSFAEALTIYREIARLYPDWRMAAIQARLEGTRGEADTVGRQIFTIPDGVIEIKVGMIREGKRYDDGRAIAGKVKSTGEDEYEVDNFTVTVVREGPLLGASCTCPDYSYRGSKHGFACKHIWAVIFHEKLLQ
jgi:hypothetical protein